MRLLGRIRMNSGYRAMSDKQSYSVLSPRSLAPATRCI